MPTAAALLVLMAVWVALLPQAASAQAQTHPPVRLMCADYNGEAPDYYRSIPRKSPVRRRVLARAVQEANTALAESGGGEPLPESLTPHSLRRTFASLLFAVG